MAMADALGGDGVSASMCTVVGGRSCPVGRSLVPMLLRSRHFTVRIADLRPSIVIEEQDTRDRIVADALLEGRIVYVQIDLRDKAQVLQAIGGSEVVFLMDLVEASVGDFCTQYSHVVQGTRNVISACRQCKVKRLIYNSCADVVFDGLHDIEDGDESLPYPHKYGDSLSELKAQAEAIVLFSNGKDGVSTCALRPSIPFGHGDVHLVKFLVGEARVHRDKYIVGNDWAICDFTHVENIAHAHVLVEIALRSDKHSIAGKPFFITNLETMKLLDFMTVILQGLGYQRPKIILPAKYILFIAALMEWVQRKLRLRKNARSCFDPSVMRSFSCTRTFNCSQAKKYIGYKPVVPLEEGIRSTVELYSHVGDLSSYIGERDLSRVSKAEKYLGCGEVAEVLLWRDEKKTFSYVLSLFLLFNWFLLSSRMFVASVAKLLMLLAILLFVRGKLPSTIYGFPLVEISPLYFRISKTTIRNVLKCLASLWNGGINILRTLEQGADWSLFLKVSGYLVLFRFISHFSPSTLVYVGLVLPFSMFIVYEQYEAEFDSSVAAASAHLVSSKDEFMKRLPSSVVEHIEKFL